MEKSPVLTVCVDPHSFFADPDPAVFLNADPDKEFSLVEKRLLKSKKQWYRYLCKFTLKI